MSPKEKALELYNRFFREVPFLQSDDDIRDDMNAAKRCALIAVDEIFQLDVPGYPTQSDYDIFINYWDEVKQEIEKL